MLNFQKLVLEQTPAPAAPTNATSTQQTAPQTAPQTAATPTAGQTPAAQTSQTPATSEVEKQVFNFFQGLLDEFNAVYEPKYGTKITPDVLKNTLVAIKGSGDKNQYTAQSFINSGVYEYFPFIDFVTFIFTKANDGGNPNINKFNDKILANKAEEYQKIAKTYISNNLSKASKGTWVLDYPATTAHAQNLATAVKKALSQSLVGETFMEQPRVQALSMKMTVYELMSARKKIRDKENKAPKANDLLDKLVLNASLYTGAQQLVPAQFQKVYTDVIAKQLVELGLLIKKFYEHEFNNVKEKAKQTPGATLKEFYENASLTKSQNGKDIFDWKLESESTSKTEEETPKPEEEQTTTPAAESTEFDKLFNSCLDLLFEKNARQRRKERRAKENAAKQQASKPSENEEPALEQPTPEPTPSPEPTPTSAFKEPDPTKAKPEEDELVGGYNIGNIKKLKQQGNDSAKAVYDRLVSLADYIRNGEPRDVIGAIQSAAGAMKALSRIGGPTMGSR